MAEGELPRLILIMQYISSLPAIILSYMQRPKPPLLPLSAAADDAHPTIMQKLEKLEVGKFAVTLATTATLGLFFSDTFPAVKAHNLVIIGFMAACTAVWNGILFEKTSLQLLGISLIMVCLYGLVGSFLPPSFTWACWLLAAFSLIPFLYLVIKLRPIPIPIPIPIPVPTTT